ncbi:hypothetical protein HOLleu_17431 [Holothuria leucospilota]|uniref:Uncharacterized protein n=1 Tax=Holothuria leucospilota TaxID=206669 RepID=A0A9Q1H8T6_HOLLE|nr:hypothetical protein HOLleu_17431 [Holothuria leucospilota]
MSPSTSYQGHGSNWTGYEWNVPLDELVDCDKCPSCCQRCYFYAKGRPKWQKGLLVCLYLALFDIGLALLFRFLVFSDTSFYIGVGDQRLINRGDDDFNLSPILCSSYSLHVEKAANADTFFDSYLLTSSPKLSDFKTSLSTRYKNVTIPKDDIYMMYHYLGKSGTVTLSVCAHDRWIDMYAVRSKSSIPTWESRKCCGRYSDSFLFRPCRQDGSPEDTRTYSSSEGYSGDLFFILMNSEYDSVPVVPTPLNVSDVVERFEYKWSSNHITEECQNTSTCTMKTEKGPIAVVVESPRYLNGYMEIRATCVASVRGYMAFFFGLPVGVVASIGFIAAVLYGLQKQVNRLADEGDRRRAMESLGRQTLSTGGRRNRFTSSRSPLVSNEVLNEDSRIDPPPSYDSVTPSYDSVAVSAISHRNEPEEPPPSYSSVTLNNEVL